MIFARREPCRSVGTSKIPQISDLAYFRSKNSHSTDFREITEQGMFFYPRDSLHQHTSSEYTPHCRQYKMVSGHFFVSSFHRVGVSDCFSAQHQKKRTIAERSQKNKRFVCTLEAPLPSCTYTYTLTHMHTYIHTHTCNTHAYIHAYIHYIYNPCIFATLTSSYAFL